MDGIHQEFCDDDIDDYYLAEEFDDYQESSILQSEVHEA